MEEKRSLRYRVQIATTSKGVKSYEAVVDGEMSEEELLAKVDSLVAQMDKRCPIVVEEKK